MIRYILLITLFYSYESLAGVYTARSSLSWAKVTAEKINCVLLNEQFLSEVGAFRGYTFTDKKPKEVEMALRNMGSVVISTYKTRNPWSKAIATTYPDDKNTVYFNTRKNPRPIREMVNTGIHEGLHLQGFSHGDNSPVGKEDSVNYRVGLIAEKYAEGCK